MDEPSAAATESNDMGEAVSTAFEGMAHALVIMLQVVLLVLLQAIRAVCILAVPALKLACVAATGYGAVTLYSAIYAAYGGDLAAVVLALAVVVTLPAFLVVLQPDKTWGAFLLSGVLSWGAAWLIGRASVVARAFLPVLMLAGCVLYFAFGEKAQNESEVNA